MADCFHQELQRAAESRGVDYFCSDRLYTRAGQQAIEVYRIFDSIILQSSFIPDLRKTNET